MLRTKNEENEILAGKLKEVSRENDLFEHEIQDSRK